MDEDLYQDYGLNEKNKLIWKLTSFLSTQSVGSLPEFHVSRFLTYRHFLTYLSIYIEGNTSDGHFAISTTPQSSSSACVTFANYNYIYCAGENHSTKSNYSRLLRMLSKKSEKWIIDLTYSEDNEFYEFTRLLPFVKKDSLKVKSMGRTFHISATEIISDKVNAIRKWRYDIPYDEMIIIATIENILVIMEFMIAAGIEAEIYCPFHFPVGGKFTINKRVYDQNANDYYIVPCEIDKLPLDCVFGDIPEEMWPYKRS